MYYFNTPNKEYSKIYLDKIKFNNGELKFFYSNDRVDLANDVKLQTISLVDKDGSTSKSWDFDYGYFIGTSMDRDVVGTSDTRHKRLKLNSILEKGKNGESLTPYVFTYDESQGLNAPSKSSFGMDHWGYFNGRFSGTHLVPDVISNYANSLVARTIGIISAENRTVNPSHNQLFILKEIQYPTGGRTVFEYETNDFDIEKSKVNDHSYFKNFPEVIAKTIQKTYPGDVHVEQPQPFQTQDYILDLTDLHVDPEAEYPQAPVQLTAFFRYDGSVVAPPCIMSGRVTIQLIKEDGSPIPTIGATDIAAFLDHTEMPRTICSTNDPNNPSSPYVGAKFENVYNLSPGKYLWKVTINSSATYIEDVHLRIDYYANKVQQDINNNGEILSGADFGGGLRVKRISDYDNIHSTPFNVRRYQYNYTDEGIKKSFGRRMAAPVYAYFDKKYYEQDCWPAPGSVSFHTWSSVVQSESLISLESSVSGASVGYDQVIEYHGENGENGKTVYEFENEPHIILDYSVMDFVQDKYEKIPRKPPSFGAIKNFGNGNLKTKTDFKLVNGVYSKVAETINIYSEFYPANNIVTYGIEKRTLNGYLPNPFCQFEAFVYPAMAKSRKLLVSSVNKTYDQHSETLALTETTTYEYNHTSHLQLIRTTADDSRGRIETTENKYPLDYNDQDDDAAIALMKSTKFMHSAPIYIEKSISESGSRKIKEVEIIKYSADIVPGLVLPSKVAKLEVKSPIDPSSLPQYLPASGNYPTRVSPKIDFTKYDSKGNLLQANTVDDINNTFIWDYQSSLPVAKIVNASFDDVAYTGFEADGTGNWTNSGNVISDATAPTGKKVCQITSESPVQRENLTRQQKYIISVWTKDNDPLISASNIDNSPAVTTPWTIKRTQGSWRLLEATITNADKIVLGAVCTIDELRLYPSGAQINTIAYDPLVGIISECDVNNKITYYEYDEFNRLKLIRDQSRNILKSIQYKYQEPQQ
jgi:hypothetical protein